jgi:hypothetical protein
VTDGETGADLPDIVFAVEAIGKQGKDPQVILVDVHFFRHMSIFLALNHDRYCDHGPSLLKPPKKNSLWAPLATTVSINTKT